MAASVAWWRSLLRRPAGPGDASVKVATADALVFFGQLDGPATTGRLAIEIAVKLKAPVAAKEAKK